MTRATHMTIPNRQIWRRIIATTLGAATIVAISFAVMQQQDEMSITGRADRAAAPAAAVHTAPDEVSVYARSQGLAGLSPASLARQASAAVTPSEIRAVYQVYLDVAQSAFADGMTGLSPASLAPLTRVATEP